MKRSLLCLCIAVSIIISSLGSVAYARSYDNDYPEVYDLYWNNKTAKWSVDGKAHRYEVVLYRDGRRVYKKTQTSRSRSFASEMLRGSHEYYFEVRPYNNITGWGEWVSSDSVFITHSYTPSSDITPHSIVPSVPVIPGTGPGENINIPTPQIVPENNNGISVAGNWIQKDGKWYYVYANGVFATNTWLQFSGKWYYVDTSGAMLTGLANIGSHTYYLNPDGSMATGTIILNGITHYFDQNGIMIY